MTPITQTSDAIQVADPQSQPLSPAQRKAKTQAKGSNPGESSEDAAAAADFAAIVMAQAQGQAKSQGQAHAAAANKPAAKAEISPQGKQLAGVVKQDEKSSKPEAPKSFSASEIFQSKAGKPNAVELKPSSKQGLDAPNVERALVMNSGDATGTVAQKNITTLSKPWSKDWVFVGNEQEDPELKPFFDKQGAGAQGAKPLGMPPKGPAKSDAKLEMATEAELEALARELAKLDGEVMMQEVHAPAQSAVSEARFAPQPQGQQLGQPQQGLPQPGMNLNALSGNPQAQMQSPGLSAQPVQSRFSSSQNPSGTGLKQPEITPRARPVGMTGDEFVGANPMIFSGSANPAQAAKPKVAEVTGRVTQGAMTRERLTSESLLSVSNQIRALTPQGGGEMKIRLKPDNLGELHVRVKTHGNDVGLQIHAANENAKAIIEESLVHLKDSLQSQNLNLARADVSVQSQLASHASSGGAQGDLMDRGLGQYPQNSQQAYDWMNAQDGRQNQRGNDWMNDDLDYAPVRPSVARAAQAYSRAGNDGRLDVMA